MTSLAASTREAVRQRPFLYEGLRAGVINYTAAARTLPVEGETEAVATALRRYAAELSGPDETTSSARVSMQSGVGPVETDSEGADPLLTVGENAYAADRGSETVIVVTGEIDVAAFERVLGTLRAEEIAVEAAGFADETIRVVVGRRDGPDAVRAVEAVVGR